MVTEKNIYNPIDFLKLNIGTIGYLELGMQNYKGGPKNQLLIANVLFYVNCYGAEALRQFKHFKNEYWDDLLEKFSKHGFDLEDLPEVADEIDPQIVERVGGFNQVHRAEEAVFYNSNLHTSGNYAMFEFLKFNRKVSPEHVRELVESINSFGVLSYPVVVKTDCLDGSERYYIADGQHRFTAMKELGLPIYFTLHNISSKEQLVRLIAKVNNTSKKWSLSQYLKAWVSLKIDSYLALKKQYIQSGLQLSVLLEAYSGRDRRTATVLYMDGKFNIPDKEKADLHIQYLVDFKKFSKRSRMFNSTLLKLFKHPKYDHTKMLQKMDKEYQTLVFSETEQELYQQLLKLHNS